MNTGRLLPSIVSKLNKTEKISMKIRESSKTIVRKLARLVHVVIKIKSFWKKTSMIIEKNSCSNSIQFQKIVIVTSNIVKKRWEKRICHWSNRLSKATNQFVITLKMWILTSEILLTPLLLRPKLIEKRYKKSIMINSAKSKKFVPSTSVDMRSTWWLNKSWWKILKRDKTNGLTLW